jgi:predicted small metal-binding protein
MSPHRRLRCADLGEYGGCLALIDGADREIVLERLRVHLRDAHGVTPAGFARRRRDVEARLDDQPLPTKE